MKQRTKVSVLLSVFLVVSCLSYLASTGPVHRVRSHISRYAWTSQELAARIDSVSESVQKLRERNRQLERALERWTPEDVYIVIHRAANRLYLKRGDTILLEATCSTGSGEELAGPWGRRWRFETPEGVFKILGKYDTPTWIKPDWAFVEEEEPIPARGAPERLQDFMLGQYALTFGDGYMIHGTLYTRLLGESVTHGCVRLGDEDLEAVYLATKVGTRIYIY